MERQDSFKLAVEIFTLLVKGTRTSKFTFPSGGVATRSVYNCLDVLSKNYGGISPSRIIDYCICQVHTLYGYGPEYFNRWKPSHSFGKKAQGRFLASNSRRVYYENRWLSDHQLDRGAMHRRYAGRKEHPLQHFVYPSAEDRTKARLEGEARLLICRISTLLWTPFSPVCQQCALSENCIAIIRKKYPELYRLRIESFKEQQKG